jgi:hypothetical protein
MLNRTLHGAIDANASDVLDFLERTCRGIYPYRQELGAIKEMESELRIEVEQRGNIVSIYAKLCTSDMQGDEIIRFEIQQVTRSMSMIKGLYDGQNPRCRLMFYRIWTRLAIAFGAAFVKEAFTKLRELEQSGPTAEFGEKQS